MKWKRRKKCNAPILDKTDPLKFPNTFYTAFSTVFGRIKDEKRALRFLKSLNREMNRLKGGGKLTKNEILELRKESVDVTRLCTYTDHHVTPTSRDDRPKGVETIDERVLIPAKFHAAWHIIFLNLYDEETIEFLERIFFILGSNKENIDYCELTGIIESLQGEKALSRV